MANSTLDAIRTKVRRLTRSPSTALITDAQLDEYINTFILYDFPEHLRLFSLRTTLTFYTQPFQDVYETSTNVNDPLFNFKNKYVAVHPPIYMAGIQAFYTQWRDVFYSYYPQTNFIADTQLRGNGGPGPFAGTLQAVPVLQNNVFFSTVDTNGASLIIVDYPQSNTTGILSITNQDPAAPVNLGTINYVTGAFSFQFVGNTQAGAVIYSNTIAYQPGKPIAMLFYDNKFTIRPVPDKSYAIQLEVDIRPTELLSANQEPQLSQWWQYIAYGAALKIFQDRMDMDSAQMIMPEFKQQERLVLRSTLTTQANERTVTIYSQGKYYGFGWFGPSGWPY